jgi:hypothetical protein
MCTKNPKLNFLQNTSFINFVYFEITFDDFVGKLRFVLFLMWFTMTCCLSENRRDVREQGKCTPPKDKKKKVTNHGGGWGCTHGSMVLLYNRLLKGVLSTGVHIFSKRVLCIFL